MNMLIRMVITFFHMRSYTSRDWHLKFARIVYLSLQDEIQ